MSESTRNNSGPYQHGDTVRLRHGLHFNDCEATGHHSTIYVDYLCRDLEPHLLAVLRELEIRASMVLAGEPRRRVLALLYERQDSETETLPAFFIQCTDAESPSQLGFGHVGSGHMGITDNVVWNRHLDEFRENIWSTTINESRRRVRRSPGF